jgi:hypothetical protein
MEHIMVNCIVAVRDAEGVPDFYPVKIECTKEQYDNGEHYDAAKYTAKDDGYDAYLAYDENDLSSKYVAGLFNLFDWNSVNITDIL